MSSLLPSPVCSAVLSISRACEGDSEAVCVCVFCKSRSAGISPIDIRRTRSGVGDSPSVVWLSSRVCSAVLLWCVREMLCRAGFGAGGGCAAASSEGELLRWLCCVSKGNDSDDAETHTAESGTGDSGCVCICVCVLAETVSECAVSAE